MNEIRRYPLPAMAVLGALLLSPARLFAQTVPSYAGPPPDTFLKRWLLLGPIPITDDKAPDEEAQKKAFETDFLVNCGGEAQAFAKTPPACSVGGHGLTWKSVGSRGEMVDLAKEVGAKDYAVVYALAELESRTATSVIAALGSDDAVKVWLNGKLIHRNWVLRALTKDQDQVVLPLHAGRNVLLLKIHNDRLEWSFCLRVLGAKALEKALWQASKDGDLDKMETILNRGRGIRIDAKSKYGLTAWQIANVFGRAEATELLAKRGARTTLPTPKPEAVIEDMLSEATSGKTPGAAVLVSRDGKVLFAKGYGYASLEHEVRITPETKFRIASISKQFTAAAILRLQEQGKLKVSDPLAKYFPDFPKGKQITLHQLLTHTSGIHNLTQRPDFELMAASAIDADDSVELLKKDPYDFEPGAKCAYNNSGYFLLGEIVAKVAGQSYADYLRTQFFEPLGMKDTGVHTPDAILAHEATGYFLMNNSSQKAPNWSMSRIGGAGALYSTVLDLQRWNEALFGGKILGEASLNTAWRRMSGDSRNASQSPLPTESSGYGWFVGKFRGLSEIQHSGSWPGFCSQLSRYPSERLTVVVLDNTWCSLPRLMPHNLANDIAQLYLAQKMDPAPKVIALSAEALDRFVGRYNGVNDFLTVTREGNRLFARMNLWTRFEIFPKSENEFFDKDTDFQVAFTDGEKGPAKKALYRFWGMPLIDAPRIEEPVAIHLAPAILDAYVGKYDYGQRQAIMTVSREGNQLYAQVKGQPKYEIFPKSETVFFWKAVPAEIAFVKDARGKVTGGIQNQGGRKLDVPRIEDESRAH